MKLKNIASYFLFFVISVTSFIACEREYVPNLPVTSSDIVVEGYIEAGKKTNQTYVVITKALPFFKEFSNLADIYISNATVLVIDSTLKDSVYLLPFCFTDLPKNLQKQAAISFGINIDSVGTYFNPCIYLDFYSKLKPQNNRTYKLKIRLPDGRELSSSTTIPRYVGWDSAQFIKPPGVNNNDTMAQLRVLIHDPSGPDFYRYLTSTNGGPLTANRSTVTDDGFFDGQPFKFNVFKSIARGETVDASISGLFKRGDTISVKFSTLDKATFNFWGTLEYNANTSGSPFANYTKVKHNIVGGLGCWGGYSVSYLDTIVPKK